MSNPIIIGDASVHNHHTSGRISLGQVKKKTIVKQGKYKDLLAALPKKGATFDGLRVVEAELLPAKGGMGLLTVTGTSGGSSGGGGSTDKDEIVYEVEMAQIEKPILCHKQYSAYAGAVDAWRNGDPSLRPSFQYKNENGTFQLAGKALEAAKLIQKGIESYLVFAPVCRRTTRVSSATEKTWKDEIGGNCGKRVNPAPEALRMVNKGPKWEWLKTADRAQETSGGGCERVEEWTAADEWSHELYEAGSGN